MRVSFAVKVGPSALVALAATWLLVSLISWGLFVFEPFTALLIGLGIGIAHWLSLSIHHLGHVFAARRIGYPMHGVRYWGWLATSLYPQDEGSLPRGVHLRRAIGGPIGSMAFAVLVALLAVPLYKAGVWVWQFLAFAALDSFFIFAIGSLIPVGFNDGSTLLRWLRETD